MDLTLPQRLYLLSYDLDRGRFEPISRSYRGQLLCAAALAQLTIDGHLSVRADTVHREVAREPADAFLADVLSDVTPEKPQHFNAAVYLRMGSAETTVRAQLIENGTMAMERRRALGLIPIRTPVPTDPERVRELRDQTRNAVLAGPDAASVPVGDAALIAIAAEGDVWTVLTPGERHRHRPALTAIRERFDTEIPGLRVAVRTAVIATGKGAVY